MGSNSITVSSKAYVGLDEAMCLRISRAMRAEGAQVFAEWARRAFTARCRDLEAKLLAASPAEYERIYGSLSPD
jgi:hypothetical protein